MLILQMIKRTVFNYCFSYAFRKKQCDIIISCENNGVLSSPLLSEEDIKQYLLRINIFTSVGLND